MGLDIYAGKMCIRDRTYLHISMADFVVYVVVAAPVKPDPVSYTHLAKFRPGYGSAGV